MMTWSVLAFGLSVKRKCHVFKICIKAIWTEKLNFKILFYFFRTLIKTLAGKILTTPSIVIWLTLPQNHKLQAKFELYYTFLLCTFIVYLFSRLLWCKILWIIEKVPKNYYTTAGDYYAEMMERNNRKQIKTTIYRGDLHAHLVSGLLG